VGFFSPHTNARRRAHAWFTGRATDDLANAPVNRRVQTPARTGFASGRLTGPGGASVGVFGPWALRLDAYFEIGI